MSWKDANIVSRLFFFFMGKVIKKGWMETLLITDLEVPADDLRLEVQLEEVMSTGWSPKTVFQTMRVFWWEYVLLGMMLFVQAGMDVLVVYVIYGSLLRFVLDPTQAFWWGVVEAVLFLVGSICSSLLLQYAVILGKLLSLKTMVRFRALISHRCVKEPPGRIATGKLSGQLMNTSYINQFLQSAYTLILTPAFFIAVGIVFGLTFGWILFGAIIGLWIVLFVLEIALTFRLTREEHKREKLQAARVTEFDGALSSILTIKTCVMEDAVIERLRERRREEEGAAWQKILLETLLGNGIPAVASSAPSIILFTIALTAGSLPLDAAFAALVVLNLVSKYILPFCKSLEQYAQAKSALDTLNGWNCVSADWNVKNYLHDKGMGPSVVLSSASFAYLDKLTEPCVVGASFALHKGEWLLVEGATGSGKTSLLRGMLGQISCVDGRCEIFGKMAYAPQTPLFVRGTFRDNVLFGTEFDELRYRRAIHACRLDTDLAQFSEQDALKISPGGANLSGGQKQRLGLARALYADATVLLLDDPFSSLDSVVSQQVSRRMRTELRECIVVMCLAVAEVIVGEKRAILQGGKLQEVIETVPSTVEEEKWTESDIAQLKWKVPEEQKVTADVAKSAALIQVTSFRKTVKIFARFVKKQALLFLAGVLIYIVRRISYFFYIYWLTFYVNSVAPGVFIAGYVSAVAVFVLCGYAGDALVKLATVRCVSSSLAATHNSVFHTSYSLLDQSTTRKVSARVSSDAATLDFGLPLAILLDAFFSVCLTVFVFAYFLPVSLSVLAALPLFFVLLVLFTRATQAVLARRPAIVGDLVAAISQLVTGAPVIQGLAKESFFLSQVCGPSDGLTGSQFGGFGLIGWLAVRTDLLSAIMTIGLIFIVLSFGGGKSGGLILVYGYALGPMIANFVLQFGVLAGLIAFMERLMEFEDLPSEDDQKGRVVLPESWPSQGAVEFAGVSVRHRSDLPEVTHKVSFQLQPGWRVVVVGRTGAGKSSLVAALLRLVSFTGRISIDGVDITSIPVKELRRRLGIVMQESAVLEGGVMFNMSPDGSFSEGDVRALLGKIGLDAVAAGTVELKSLSKGQLQGFCVCRALIKRSKVLVMDEAASSVEGSGEEMLEALLKAADATFFAVTHKLSSIQLATKVLVIEAGRVVEFHSPQELLKNSSSMFSNIIRNFVKGDTAAFSAGDNFKCSVCYSPFSAWHAQRSCPVCLLNVCSFCFREEACYFCFKTSHEKGQDPSNDLVLARRITLDEPCESSCSGCGSVGGARRCGRCSKLHCDGCTIFLRSFWVGHMSQSARQLCTSCFESWTAETDRNDVDFQREFFAEVYVQSSLKESQEKFALQYAKRNCSVCSVSCLTASCAVCRAAVCASTSSLCAGLIFVPSLKTTSYVLVCVKCVSQVTPLVPFNGEPEGFVVVSSKQVEFGAQQVSCCCCTKGFSYFYEAYKCDTCLRGCCRMCAHFTTRDALLCNECFVKPTKDVQGSICCDVCGEAMGESEILWVNERQIHPDCMSKFQQIKANDKTCVFCGRFVLAMDRVILNGEVLHAPCVVGYRKGHNMKK